MNNQSTSEIRKIIKKKQNSYAMKLAKLFMLVAFFYTGSIHAQSVVLPYPATSMGQSLLITPSSSLWSDMMRASGEVRALAQEYVNSCGTCTPGSTNYISCTPTVCCSTNVSWVEDHYEYYTTCWTNDADKKKLCTISQPY